jgi:hypothetical protein
VLTTEQRIHSWTQVDGHGAQEQVEVAAEASTIQAAPCGGRHTLARAHPPTGTDMRTTPEQCSDQPQGVGVGANRCELRD